MDKELDKLSSEHVNNIKEELTEDKPIEEKQSIEEKPKDKEKVKCCNPGCNGNAMIRRATGEVVNGYCRDCTRAGFSKKKKALDKALDKKTTPKGTDMAKIKEDENKKKKKDIKNTITLDMSKYPQIYKYLIEISDTSMLPKEHVIMSLIGAGIARSLAKKR